MTLCNTCVQKKRKNPVTTKGRCKYCLPHAREQIQKHHNYSLLKSTCYQSIEDPRRGILHHHPKEMCKYTYDDYKRKKKAKVDGYENFPRHCVYKTVKTPVHTRSSVVSKRSKKTSSKRFHPTARARDHKNETKTGSGTDQVFISTKSKPYMRNNKKITPWTWKLVE
jgi:hypothetical protein